MATNINSLPLYKASFGVGLDEDFAAPLVFTNADGSALSLTGIGFSMTIGALATLTIGSGLTVSGNTLSAFYPAASKAGWPPGSLSLGLLATDPTGSLTGGLRSEDIFTNSNVTVGSPFPLVLTKIPTAASTLVSAGNAQLAANTAAIAALQAGGGTPAPTVVSAATYTIAAAGDYYVTYAGCVLTLPAVAGWAGGDIFVADATGAANPNILISGTVNQDSGGVLLNVRNQAVTLRNASPAVNSWMMR